jgi:tetratricopeptide (TPR) repeat protein
VKIRSRRAALLGCLFFAWISGPVALSPQERADDPYAQAGRLIDLGWYGKAISAYREILEKGEDANSVRTLRIYDNLGYCHYKKNEFDEACVWYRRALELDDRYPVCLNNIASALIKQSRFRDALPYLYRVRDLDPDSIKVIFNLFTAYAQLEDEARAKQYLKLSPDKDKAYTIGRLKMKNVSDLDIARIQRLLDQDDKSLDSPGPFAGSPLARRAEAAGLVRILPRIRRSDLVRDFYVTV